MSHMKGCCIMKTSTVKKINTGIILGSIVAIYWLVIVAAYCLVSFLTEKWSITWIVWPVAMVLFLIAGFIYFNVKRGNLIKKHSFLFTIIGTIVLFLGTYLLVSFLVQPSVWHISWLIFIGMFIAIFIETIVFFVGRNKNIDATNSDQE